MPRRVAEEGTDRGNGPGLVRVTRDPADKRNKEQQKLKVPDAVQGSIDFWMACFAGPIYFGCYMEERFEDQGLL